MNLTEFKNLAKQGNVIPVYATYLADLLTPVSAFMRLQKYSNRAFLLESVEGGEKTARFSFLGCDPFLTLSVASGRIECEENGQKVVVAGTIFDYLRELFSKYRAVRPAGLPRFTGGAVGYFGYETVRYVEHIPVPDKIEPHVPEAVVMLCDTVLAFDHLLHQIYIIKNVILDERSRSLEEEYQHAMARIESLERALDEEIACSCSPALSEQPVLSNFSRARFCRAVVKAKAYITKGDIFQVVLSQRFRKDVAVPPFDIYRALRVINPSPYLYFLKMDDLAIIGSSPELLVRVENRQVEVRPIAGTRRRGQDEAEDKSLMDELRQDEKEIAEHVMLVDLGRNDVGRVSQYGSVAVTEFMTVEKYSHVMHLVSDVQGRLKPELGAIEALQACFPAGTVSGAPKIRAMEIIAELEPEQRGVYAGALGYLDFSGNLDTCIAIRTIVMAGKTAYFQAGAGIVADSVPEREFQETLEKAAALRAALEFAERGLR
ncbi:MAG: anthranilate synthase component I [bacterium]